jgi:hypothetical protein
LYNRPLERLGLHNHPLHQVQRDVAYETFNVKNRGPEFLNQVVQWFREIENANKKHGIYSAEALHRFLRERLFIVLHYNTAYPRSILNMFFRERLYRDVGFFKSIKFLVKVLLCFLGFYRTPGRRHRDKRQG